MKGGKQVHWSFQKLKFKKYISKEHTLNVDSEQLLNFGVMFLKFSWASEKITYL